MSVQTELKALLVSEEYELSDVTFNLINNAITTIEELEAVAIGTGMLTHGSFSVSEVDPTERNPNEAGAKLDAGKIRAGLVLRDFSSALTAVAAVGTFGANKYSAHGWLSVPNSIERYTDALYRHLLKDAGGELIDPDSGLTHKAHAAWNALAILELTNVKEQVACALVSTNQSTECVEDERVAIRSDN